MPLASTTTCNQALNGADASGSPTNVIAFVALHTATTGTTGTNENANAGSYARQACTWNAASSASKTNSSSLAFTTAGSVAVTHAAGWSSGTYGAGTFGIGLALTAPITAVSITFAPGALTLTAS